MPGVAVRQYLSFYYAALFSGFVYHIVSSLFFLRAFDFSHPPHPLAFPLPAGLRSVAGSRGGPLSEADNISAKRMKFNKPALL
jgi:hypothetical protein